MADAIIGEPAKKRRTAATFDVYGGRVLQTSLAVFASTPAAAFIIGGFAASSFASTPPVAHLPPQLGDTAGDVLKALFGEDLAGVRSPGKAPKRGATTLFACFRTEEARHAALQRNGAQLPGWERAGPIVVTLPASDLRASSPGGVSRRVGVYFGAFDPVHEQHLRIARHAVTALGLARVVFVPNADDAPCKPLALSRDARLELLRARLHGETNLQVFELPPGVVAIPAVRGLVAQLLAATEQNAAGCAVQVLQLMGQDSFSRPVTQHGLLRLAAANALHRAFAVFPRKQNPAAVPVPPGLEKCVSVLADYVDEITLSSTMVRRALLCQNEAELTSWLHPAVRALIASRGWYTLLAPPPASAPRFFVMLAPETSAPALKSLAQVLATGLGVGEGHVIPWTSAAPSAPWPGSAIPGPVLVYGVPSVEALHAWERAWNVAATAVIDAADAVLPPPPLKRLRLFYASLDNYASYRLHTRVVRAASAIAELSLLS